MGKAKDLMGAGLSALAASTVVTNITTTETALPFEIDGTQVFVKKLEAGALPDTTNSAVAHGITGLDQIIAIWGWAEHASNGSRFPLPYVREDAVGNSVRVTADGTNVTITTATDWSSFSANIYVLYTKD